LRSQGLFLGLSTEGRELVEQSTVG
jgi:hypothetical protein